MRFRMDATRLALFFAHPATDAFFGIDGRSKPCKPGQKPKDRPDGANRVAPHATASPCQNDDGDKRHHGNDKTRDAFDPDVDRIKGITVEAFGQIGGRVVAQTIKWGKEVGRHAPKRAVWGHQKRHGMNAKHHEKRKHPKGSPSKPGFGRFIGKAVFVNLAGKKRGNVLQNPKRTYHRTINSPDDQGENDKPKHHAHIECQKGWQKLNVRQKTEPVMHHARKIKK